MGVTTTTLTRTWTTMIAAVVMLSVVTASSIQDGAVTPHWEHICGSTLLFSEDAKTWDDARGTCELFGGNLVDITSLEMNSCILSHYHQKGLPSGYYWHSGNDIKEEGVWRYNTYGDLINWTPIWGGYENPDGGRAENCLDIYLSNEKYAGKWSDFGCSSSFHYICEK